MLSSLVSFRAIKIFVCLSMAISGLLNAAQGYFIAEEENWIEEKDVYLPLNIPEGDISNGIYYLFLDKQIKVDEIERKTYTAFATYVANRSGVDENSQVNIYYDPTYETIKIHSVTVKRDGVLLSQLEKAKITELRTEPELSNLIYNGETQINIILNDVRVGDIIEYRYTREGSNPVYEGNFSLTRYQQWNISILNQRLRLLWLKEGKLKVDDSRANQAISQLPIDGGTLYEFEVDANEAIELDEDTPGSVDPYERVYFTEAKTWRDVVEWSLPLYQSSISQDKAILEIADEIKKKNPTKAEQVAAALVYVQDNIRYFGIELGKNSHQPSPALATLERRYGDCKDKAVLFISILKLLGIEAFPALVNTEETSLLKTMPPMFNVFDHVIVKVDLDNKVYWLDPTRIYQYGTLENIYQPNYEFALVVDEKTNYLTKMDVSNSSSVKIIEEFDFFDGDKVNYKIKSIYKGKDAERFYDTILSDGVSALESDYLKYYKQSYPDIEIKDAISISEYENSGVLEVLENYQFNADINQYDFEMFFDAYNLGSYLEAPSDIDRKFSYDQYTHTHREHEFIIKLPKDKFEIKNYSYQNLNDYFDYTLIVESDKKTDVLKLNYRFIEKRRVVNLNDFDTYLEDLDGSLNNTTFTLSNEKHKKLIKNNSLGLTLNNILTYIFSGLFVVAIVLLIIMIIFYFIRKNKGYYNFESQRFYPISMKKFILMNVFTLGLFHVFWSYKNWIYIEKENKKSFWSFPRSFFYAFTFYSFNSWVNKKSMNDSDSENGYSNDIAIFILIGLISAFVFNAFNDSVFEVLIILLVVLCYAPFVRFFSNLNNEKNINFEKNSELTVLHYIFFICAFPLVVYTVVAPFNLFNEHDVILGEDIYESQIKYFKAEGLIGNEEGIKMISSTAMFDIRDNGSGFSDKSVFRYWQEDEGGFYFYSKPLSEISKIDTRAEEEYTVLELSFSESDFLDLYILNSESMDGDFIKALKEEWKTARL